MSSLLDARSKLAAALAPVDPADPSVLENLVDQIEPPALFIGWADPMWEPDTACLGRGFLVVTAVAGRLIPGEGITDLEDLVLYTISRVRTGGYVAVRASGPRSFVVAKTTYLAARITVRDTITT